MTVINFEKDSEADNPHMQISPHMFCAPARWTQIFCTKNSVIFITVQWRPS